MFALALVLTGCSENEINDLREDPEEPYGELQLEPDDLDFGLLELGTQASQSFTIHSVGTGPIDLASVELHGPTSYDFTWASGGLGELMPGETAEVIVSYTPHGPDETGWVAVESDAVNPRGEVLLAGGGILPALTIEPTSVELVSEMGEEVWEVVTLASTGTATLEIDELIFLGDDSLEVPLPEAPLSLEPGDFVEFEVRWEPLGQDYASGEVWIADNTPVGSAMVPITAELVPPCLGLAEAFEIGSLEARTSSMGVMSLTNTDAELDVCIDKWTVWLSVETQDMGLGDPYWDNGGVYPLGSLTIAPGDKASFSYGATQTNGWFCVEQTQTTKATQPDDWLFYGMRVPPALQRWMGTGGDQDAIWAYMNAHPVFVVGRDTNVVNPGDQVVVRLINMGREYGVAEVTELLPEGWSASDFSHEPESVELTEDGTLITWNIALNAAQDTGETQHTIYDEELISYTLELDGAECGPRTYLNEPEALWSDSNGDDQTADGSPLLVLCE